MYAEETLYFAEELNECQTRMIPSSFGNIYSITAGNPGQPLILIVHGSGPKNSCQQYRSLLQEYLVRVSYIEKFYLVAIDCPGYGKSEGSKEAVKTFPLRLFTDILKSLNYRSYYGMYGHSQGGAAIFNAVYEEPSLTQFMLMDRPVCGNIQRFRGFAVPTLLIYDIEDDGHPLWQGKLLLKELKCTKFHSYRSSVEPYWAADNMWNKMLEFFSSIYNKRTSKFLQGQYRRSILSEEKPATSKVYSQQRSSVSLSKQEDARAVKAKQEEMASIHQIQHSELLSVSEQQSIKSLSSATKKKLNKEKYEFELEEKERLKRANLQNELEEQVEILAISPPSKTTKQEQPFKQEENRIEAFRLEHRCPICHETYFRPVSTNCNHVFCNKCLTESLLVNLNCPLCRTAITKKTDQPTLHEKMLVMMSAKDVSRREEAFRRLETMLKSIVRIEVGNNSTLLQTKQSIFTKTKKKYNWEIYVREPINFPLEEVSFNINMGQPTSRPVRVKNRPFKFESRGTFSFSCEIGIKPRNHEYAELTVVYRIDVEPGNHHKIVSLKKKCYQK